MFSSTQAFFSYLQRPGRPALAQSLSVTIPQRPTIDSVVADIRAHRNNYIFLPSLMLSRSNMQSIINAFSDISIDDQVTLQVSGLFTNPHTESFSDLIAFWECVKHRSVRIIWEENRFFKKFYRMIQQDSLSDPKTARCEFINCDQTNSRSNSDSSTPSRGKSVQSSPEIQQPRAAAASHFSPSQFMQSRLKNSPLGSPAPTEDVAMSLGKLD